MDSNIDVASCQNVHPYMCFNPGKLGCLRFKKKTETNQICLICVYEKLNTRKTIIRSLSTAQVKRKVKLRLLLPIFVPLAMKPRINFTQDTDSFRSPAFLDNDTSTCFSSAHALTNAREYQVWFQLFDWLGDFSLFLEFESPIVCKERRVKPDRVYHSQKMHFRWIYSNII